MRYVIIVLIVFLFGCNNDEEIIEITKKSKMEVLGVNSEKTVEEILLGFGEEYHENSGNFSWKVKKQNGTDIYLVSYTRIDNKTGMFWETNYATGKVKYINENPRLEEQYGITTVINTENFQIQEITVDTLLIKQPRTFIDDLSIILSIKGTVKNKTDKIISNASIVLSGTLMFGESKLIKIEKDYNSGFKKNINTRNTWMPGESLAFSLDSKPIDKIYLNYSPNYAKYRIRIIANDPIDNQFDDHIYEKDMKWNELVITSKKNKDGSSYRKSESQKTNITESSKEEDNNSYGFDIDFGGKGQRKIYSYSLPAYPDGITNEIDVRLRFTILPDGTVDKIIPLIKADQRLERIVINSLSKWKFEPLASNQKQNEQTAVITFPFREQ